MNTKNRLEKIVANIEEIIEEEINLNFVDTYEWLAKCEDGEIVISRGCVDRLNDDELAFVVCHEDVHHKMKHQDEIKKLADKCGQKSVDSINELWHSEGGFFKKLLASALVGAASYASANIQVKSLSRDQELAADKMAVEIMEQAGYDPAGARSFLQRYGGVDEGFIRNLFSTHPPAYRRLGNIS